MLSCCCLRCSTASPANAKCIMKKQLQYMSCSQLTNEPWKSCKLGSIRLHSLSLSVCRATRKPIQYQVPSQDVQVHVEVSGCEHLPARSRGVTNSGLITFQLCNMACYFSLAVQREDERRGRSARSLVMLLQIWSIMKLMMTRMKGWDSVPNGYTHCCS